MIYIHIHASHIHVYVCVLSPYYVSTLKHNISKNIKYSHVCIRMLMTEDDIGKLGTLGGEKEYFFP